MKFIVYWLVSEDKKRTYVGFSNFLEKRLLEHKTGQVQTTKNFGKFSYFILEEVENKIIARKREKHWKSCAGRRKLKKFFEDFI